MSIAAHVFRGFHNIIFFVFFLPEKEGMPVVIMTARQTNDYNVNTPETDTEKSSMGGTGIPHYNI